MAKTSCKCDLCGRTVSDKSMSKHRALHSGQKHKCPYAHCSHSTAQASNLNSHIRAKHSRQLLKCRCGWTNVQSSEMSRHRKAAHGGDKKSYPATLVPLPQRRSIKVEPISSPTWSVDDSFDSSDLSSSASTSRSASFTATPTPDPLRSSPNPIFDLAMPSPLLLVSSPLSDDRDTGAKVRVKREARRSAPYSRALRPARATGSSSSESSWDEPQTPEMPFSASLVMTAPSLSPGFEAALGFQPHFPPSYASSPYTSSSSSQESVFSSSTESLGSQASVLSASQETGASFSGLEESESQECQPNSLPPSWLDSSTLVAQQDSSESPVGDADGLYRAPSFTDNLAVPGFDHPDFDFLDTRFATPELDTFDFSSLTNQPVAPATDGFEDADPSELLNSTTGFEEPIPLPVSFFEPVAAHPGATLHPSNPEPCSWSESPNLWDWEGAMDAVLPQGMQPFNLFDSSPDETPESGRNLFLDFMGQHLS